MHPSLRAQLLQPRTIIGVTTVVAVAAIVIAYIFTVPHTSGSYVAPTQGPIVEEVDTTGTVKAAQSVDLSFQTPGRISYINAPVGAHVGVGTTLASESSADLQAAVEQAKAALQVQQAKLDALNAGARPENIAVSQAAVSGAQTSVSQAKQTVLSAARNAYSVSDDAIHGKVDQFFNNPRSISPTLAFNVNDSQLQNSVINDRVAMETVLAEWRAYVAALPADADQIDAAAVSAKTGSYLLQIGNFLDEAATVLTKAINPTSAIQGYQSAVSTGHGNVTAAVSAQNAAQTAEKAAESSLATAQSQLTLTKAPPTSQDVEEQMAQIASAQANIDAAQAQLGMTSIRAPFTGTISKNDAHLGATASPGQPLVSMISDAQFQFETFVSQADLAKLKVGDVASVQLDAYENAAPVMAHVVAIDPAATVVSGVSSYKVTLQFDAANPRIQAGLTGSAKITTEQKASALSVPTSSIITRGAQHFVLRESASGDEEVPVQTGVASASGMTEITSGISASDRVRTFGTQQQ